MLGSSIDLAPPARYESFSVDGRHVAVADPRTYTTTIYSVRADGTRAMRWRMSGWHRALLLANDGEHIAIPADDLGFVRADYDPDVAVLSIHHMGRLVRAVRLAEVVGDPRDLIRVSSFYWWGTFRGLEQDGASVRIETASRELVFDLTTGLAR